MSLPKGILCFFKLERTRLDPWPPGKSGKLDTIRVRNFAELNCVSGGSSGTGVRKLWGLLESSSGPEVGEVSASLVPLGRSAPWRTEAAGLGGRVGLGTHRLEVALGKPSLLRWRLNHVASRVHQSVTCAARKGEE